jgi:hypothetical protein
MANGYTQKNVYGNAIDLANAKSRLGSGYNYIQMDSLPNGFAADQNSILLGGLAANYQGGGNPTLLWGADRNATADAMSGYLGGAGAMDKPNYYNNMATNQYDVSYNQRVQALKNSLANKLAVYDSQKTGVNQNYDIQADTAQKNGAMTKNSFGNNMLNRGMGRSTIATTGEAGIQLGTDRNINNINTYRTNALADIDRAKTVEQNNMQQSLDLMGADRTAAIQNLAMQLQAADEQRAFQQQQFQWEQDKFNKSLEQEMAIAQLNASKYGGGSGYSSGSNTGSFSIGEDAKYLMDDIDGIYKGNSDYGYLKPVDQRIAELQTIYSGIQNANDKDAQEIKKRIQQYMTELQKEKAEQDKLKAQYKGYQSTQGTGSLSTTTQAQKTWFGIPIK